MLHVGEEQSAWSWINASTSHGFQASLMAVLASAMATAVATASPRNTFTGRRVAVGHRAENQRRNKRRQRRRGERKRLDGVQAVSIEDGAQRHKPYAQCRSLNEKQRDQLRIFRPRVDCCTPTGHTGGGKIQASPADCAPGQKG